MFQSDLLELANQIVVSTQNFLFTILSRIQICRIGEKYWKFCYIFKFVSNAAKFLQDQKKNAKKSSRKKMKNFTSAQNSDLLEIG